MIRVPPTLEGKARALAAVEDYGARHGWSREIRSEFALILEEWLQNIVSYSQAPESSEMRLVITPFWDEVWLEVRDGGRPFNPLEAKMPDVSAPAEERPIGGNGILMMRRLVEEMRWERTGDENVLRFKKSTSRPKLRHS